eukprot:7781085-Pyramimonas_sp.AAC.1
MLTRLDVPELKQATLLEACGLGDGFIQWVNASAAHHDCIKGFWKTWEDMPNNVSEHVSTRIACTTRPVYSYVVSYTYT